MLLEGTGFALALGDLLYLAVARARMADRRAAARSLAGHGRHARPAREPRAELARRRAGPSEQDLRRSGSARRHVAARRRCRWSSASSNSARCNVRWDSNAYGSIVWILLGLHTTHLMTDLGDTIVLAVLMFTRHGHNKRRFGDVQDNALYWNFVVLTWLPIYACIYWVPRL